MVVQKTDQLPQSSTFWEDDHGAHLRIIYQKFVAKFPIFVNNLSPQNFRNRCRATKQQIFVAFPAGRAPATLRLARGQRHADPTKRAKEWIPSAGAAWPMGGRPASCKSLVSEKFDEDPNLGAEADRFSKKNIIQKYAKENEKK